MIKKVVFDQKFLKQLQRRGVSNQFRKAVKYILKGSYRQVNLKIRQPKHQKVFYFRINRQYRARAKLDGSTLVVFHIDTHQ